MPNTPNSVVVLDQFGNIPVGVGTEGVVNGSDARAGTVGEFMQAIRLQSNGLGVPTGTPTSIASLTLTPGDWDVWGTIGFSIGSPIVSLDLTSIGTVNNVSGALETNTTVISGSISLGGGIVPTPTVRLNVTASTPVFVVVQLGFTGGGNVDVFGSISARRMR